MVCRLGFNIKLNKGYTFRNQQENYLCGKLMLRILDYRSSIHNVIQYRDAHTRKHIH